jgi:hypothetical protein
VHHDPALSCMLRRITKNCQISAKSVTILIVIISEQYITMVCFFEFLCLK